MYSFSFTTDTTNYTATVPRKLVYYGAFSLIALVLLALFSLAYAAHSARELAHKSEQVEKLQSINIQQQQEIASILGQSYELENRLDGLESEELALRQLSGLIEEQTPDPTAVNPDAGQGGVYNEESIEYLQKRFGYLDTRTALRTNSLTSLKGGIREIVAHYGTAGGTIPSIWPTTGEVSSPYGLRWGGTDFHPGIDIANDFGTPIVATADGVVDYTGYDPGGYGNMVDITHDSTYMTRYAHAQQIVVAAGQQVKRGQIIAFMGSTGFSTGPHVHYEVIVNGQAVNPIGFL